MKPSFHFLLVFYLQNFGKVNISKVIIFELNSPSWGVGTTKVNLVYRWMFRQACYGRAEVTLTLSENKQKRKTEKKRLIPFIDLGFGRHVRMPCLGKFSQQWTVEKNVPQQAFSSMICYILGRRKEERGNLGTFIDINTAI